MTIKVIRTDGFYPATANAKRAIESGWDTIEDLLPVVAKAIGEAHATGLSTGMVRGFRASAAEAQRTGRNRRPSPMESCAAYMHGADIEAHHLHHWADLVAKAGAATKRKRGFNLDRAAAESVLAIEALLHKRLKQEKAA